jgi:hypothetical protein
VLEIVSRLEQAGGSLSLNGDRIEYVIPKGNRETQEMLAELRKHRERVMDLLRQRETNESNRPSASQDTLGRFRQPHAKLFPFIGRKVRTPEGPGTLLQVFADRVTVLLESEVSKCAVFKSSEIELTSGDW